MFNYNFLLILSLATLLATNAFSAPKKKKLVIPDHVEVHKDILYSKAGEHELLLDIYMPKGVESPPLVIWVHGGGWKNGSKNKIKGLWLTNEGYAMASISYRLTHQGQWPDQINDCRAAVRFLRNQASKYGYNGDKIAAWGSSAGGHLVALMGTLDTPADESTSSKVQAVIDWYGPTDLLSMPYNNVSETRTTEQVSNSNGAKLLGATVREVPDLAKQASAYYQVSKDDSPFLIMHGSADPGVPLIQSEILHQKLKEVGAQSQLVVVEGGGHGGPLFQTQEVKDTVRDFLDRTLR